MFNSNVLFYAHICFCFGRRTWPWSLTSGDGTRQDRCARRSPAECRMDWAWTCTRTDSTTSTITLTRRTTLAWPMHTARRRNTCRRNTDLWVQPSLFKQEHITLGALYLGDLFPKDFLQCFSTWFKNSFSFYFLLVIVMLQLPFASNYSILNWDASLFQCFYEFLYKM